MIRKDFRAIRFVKDTKISHDYDADGKYHTFSYRDLVGKKIPYIGIPGKINRLLIIDVDCESEQHRKDGRAWWAGFSRENQLPETYTVLTPSGGTHYYYNLPESIDLELFHPPGQLADGVDVIYNGWVKAPPTAGYRIVSGNIHSIVDIPDALKEKMFKKEAVVEHYPLSTEEFHLMAQQKPFSPDQLAYLRDQLKWVSENASPSYPQWRNGLYSLKAGIPDDELLDEFIDLWTRNRAYQEGDLVQARSIVAKAHSVGKIGPGSIFKIIEDLGAEATTKTVHLNTTGEEVLDSSGVEFKQSKDGKLSFEANETNVAIVIDRILPMDKLYHDIRYDCVMYNGDAVDKDDVVYDLCYLIQCKAKGLGLSKIKMPIIGRALSVLMRKRRVDPVKIWMEGLKWDGTPRIETFFSEYLRTENNEYTRKVSQNFWISLAARIMCPGIQLDSMVILEGLEGVGKSQLLSTLAGDYFFQIIDTRSFQRVDEYRKMHQAIIVELNELIGLVGVKSEIVKAFISMREDKIRGLFAPQARPRKRSFIFVGTTNNARYLQADLGIRRFWPIKIHSHLIDLNAIACYRNQFFAEAKYHFEMGQEFHTTPEGHKEEVRRRIWQDPTVAHIRELFKFHDKLRISDIYTAMSDKGFVGNELDFKTTNRLTRTLTAQGYEEFEVDGDLYWRPGVPFDIQELL